MLIDITQCFGFLVGFFLLLLLHDLIKLPDFYSSQDRTARIGTEVLWLLAMGTD